MKIKNKESQFITTNMIDAKLQLKITENNF